MKTNYTDTEQYISSFPENVRNMLEELRKIIREAAPEATETISYQMPTFRFHGNLVHFAACKNHIGFYSISAAMAAFGKELSDYKGTKGSLHFHYDKPLPSSLISKVVRFRVKENQEKAGKKSKL